MGRRMESYHFSRRWFFINNFFGFERSENKNDTIAFASSSRSETNTFWCWKVDFKIWPQVSSGQGQVMTQANMHIFRSGLTSRVVWYHLRVCISILSRLIGEKRIVTSFDLRRPPRDHRSSVAPGSSQMGWTAMILKELGSFGRSMRNGKHFHISP